MKKLPIWNLTTKRPAFYDMESLTAVEQTAKIYGAMQELIDEYNLFATEVNKSIDEYTTATDQDQECFKTEMTTLIENYIKSIDMKVDDLTAYLKTNLTQTIGEMFENGTLDESVLEVFNHLDSRVKTIENTEYSISYNSTNEEISLIKTVKEGE